MDFFLQDEIIGFGIQGGSSTSSEAEMKTPASKRRRNGNLEDDDSQELNTDTYNKTGPSSNLSLYFDLEDDLPAEEYRENSVGPSIILSQSQEDKQRPDSILRIQESVLLLSKFLELEPLYLNCLQHTHRDIVRYCDKHTDVLSTKNCSMCIAGSEISYQCDECFENIHSAGRN